VLSISDQAQLAVAERTLQREIAQDHDGRHSRR
jgi:hypothetical protein